VTGTKEACEQAEETESRTKGTGQEEKAPLAVAKNSGET